MLTITEKDDIKQGQEVTDCEYKGEGFRVGICLRYGVLSEHEIAEKIINFNEVGRLSNYLFYMVLGHTRSQGRWIQNSEGTRIPGTDRLYYNIRDPPCPPDCQDITKCFEKIVDNNYKINKPDGYG